MVAAFGRFFGRIFHLDRVGRGRQFLAPPIPRGNVPAALLALTPGASAAMTAPFPLPTRVPTRRSWTLWLVCFAAGCGMLALLGTSGCSGGGGGTAASEAAKTAVATFLDAIKRGDDATASGMLTKVARAKTQELGLSVAPPVNPTATYSIRECEVVGESGDLVHVGTTWTDTDADGFTSTDNVVWVVRLDPEGWRVVGMAMRIFEDLPPLLLNFEDPEDMLAKQELVAAELQKRAQQAAAKDAAEARTARGDTPATR